MQETILSKVNKVAIDMHESLRINKVSEKLKPLFIAGILVSLKDLSFLSGYREIRGFQELVYECGMAIQRVLRMYQVPESDIKRMVQSFEQISNTIKLKNTPLEEEHSLRWYILQLETRLLPLAEKNIDVIGVLYHQFIRYSSGDGSSLGIVLTPNHIADFMADLIAIKKNDNVLDICCGTGTFLTAAQKRVKNKGQVYGVEQDADLQLLAIANAVLQDGVNIHIVHGDSYHKSLEKYLEQTKFTKALLNPPYSQKDHTELDFVERALEMLEPGGMLAAICPVSCAIGTKYKKERPRIMKKHTLKAVLTMPDDLFSTNGANTFTCIMVWEAKVPHDSTKNTFFGRYKDDGFCKKKKIGRVDWDGRWQLIRQKWLETYRNQIQVQGLSVLHPVTDKDEWLCEAYMQTDYSTLTDDDFQRTINDYLAFLVKEGLQYED